MLPVIVIDLSHVEMAEWTKHQGQIDH